MLCLVFPRLASAGTALTVQLKWRHQYQFAGFYAATEQGYYAQAGLDVILKEGWPGIDGIAEVLAGNADVGVGSSNIVRARLEGVPVKALAVIYQRSPFAILALPGSGIARPQDVAGRKVVISPHDGPENWAMLSAAAVTEGDFERVDSPDRVEALIAGEVDAISGYLSSELKELRARGIEPVILRPSTYDIEFFGDALFTTEGVLASKQEALEAFTEATIRGWEYALANPQETIDLIQRDYAPLRTRRALEDEAMMVRRFIAPERKPIGTMEATQWQTMAEMLLKLGFPGDISRMEGVLHAQAPGEIRTLQRFINVLVFLVCITLLGFLLFMTHTRRVRREEKKRRAAEREAYEKGTLLEKLLQHLPVVVFQVDPQMVCKMSRGHGLRRLGLEDDSLVGRRMDLVFPQTGNDFKEALAGRTQSFSTYGGSHQSPWRFKSFVYAQENGDLIGFSIDTTPLLEAGQAQSRLVDIIESAPDIIVTFEPTGAVQYLNTAGRDFFTVAQDDYARLNLSMLYSPGAARRLVETGIPLAMAQGSWVGESLLRNVQSHELQVSVALLAHYAPDGHVQYLTAIHRDLSQRMEMEQDLKMATAQAQSASQAKSEFLAHMSHELRTPLNGILGMLQLLSLTDMTEEQQEYVQTGLASGRGLMTILADILDLSKVEAGRLLLEEAPFQLRDLVQEVAALFRQEARRKGLAFSMEVDEATPETIVGDAGRLRQVLFNLLGNAVKFTETGEVSLEVVALRMDEAHACPEQSLGLLAFMVSDTGPGFDPGTIPQLFEAFVQRPVSVGSNGKETMREGAGLGLAIVARLIHLMRGNISTFSQEGEGAEFLVTIPCRTPQPLAQEVELRPKQQESEDACRPLRILMAEDDPTNRFTLETYLTRRGHKVVAVGDGEAAFAAARESQGEGFDVMLLDIQMPKLDGVTVTTMLREAGVTIPIIAITAYAMEEEKRSFLVAGMDDYMSKPLNFKKLDELLARYAQEAPRS